MDRELSVLRAVTRRLPGVRGAGLVGNVVRDFYARRPRPRVVVPVRGVEMELDPAENVDGSLLFCPQLYDRRELHALLDELRPGDRFADVGAHIGLYALLAARRVTPGGRVLAIEADPANHARLGENVRRNAALAVETVCVAVSDTEGSAHLTLDTTGNRGGNSLIGEGGDTIEVACRPLADVLREHGFDRVDGMKLDIEGMEFRVLRRYLADVPDSRRPRIVVLEHQVGWIEAAGGDAVALLRGAGYRESLRTRINRVMVGRGARG
jgi:FkbM family methyltransferase